MTLIICPYCKSSIRPEDLEKHFSRVHPQIQLSQKDFWEMKSSQNNPKELTRNFPNKSKKSRSNKKKTGQNKHNGTHHKTSALSQKQDPKPNREPKIHYLYKKVKVNLSGAETSKSQNRSNQSKPKRRNDSWTPKLSRSGCYPIINCRKCNEEVYLVTGTFKSGTEKPRKYDIQPFQPHTCDFHDLDPLDHPDTVRRFMPKDNKYRSR